MIGYYKIFNFNPQITLNYFKIFFGFFGFIYLFLRISEEIFFVFSEYAIRCRTMLYLGKKLQLNTIIRDRLSD